MSLKDFRILKAQIETELSNASQLIDELKNKNILHNDTLGNGWHENKNDSFTLRAVGSIIHDFYYSVENIFKLIAREIDEKIPEGPDWHISLLKQMALQLPGIRPPLVLPETLAFIDELRAFRHVFQNIYGFSLRSSRIEELLKIIVPTFNVLSQDVSSFLEKITIILEEK